MSNLIREAMPDLHASLVDDLGDEVVYNPTVGADVTLSVLWSSSALLEQQKPGVAASMKIQLSDLAAAPADGDEVTFQSKVYRVVKADEVDGYGGVTLDLRFVRVAP